MSLDTSSERSVATTLAAILVAIATFCLSVMALEKEPTTTIVNEIFGVLGLGAILTSALIIDSIFDKAELGFQYRWKELMNRGYVFFCLVMASMSFAILTLYDYQEFKGLSISRWYLYSLFGFSSIFLFFKLMCDKRDRFFGPALTLRYLSSIIVLRISVYLNANAAEPTIR